MVLTTQILYRVAGRLAVQTYSASFLQQSSWCSPAGCTPESGYGTVGGTFQYEPSLANTPA